MGKNTKNFRQTARSMSGNRGAQAYSQVNRSGSWVSNIKDQIAKIKDRSRIKNNG